MGATVQDEGDLLAMVVRERSRFLAPAIFVALAFYSLAPVPFAVQPQGAAYAVVLALLVLLGLLSTAFVRRRIPLRYIHAASTAMLWAPLLAASVCLYATRNQVFGLYYVILIASAGALLETRWVIATLIGANLIAIPLLVRAGGPYTGMVVSVVLTASLFAQLIHVLMRKALLRAETHRIAESAIARQLAFQLTELERSHVDRARLQDQLLHAQRMEAVGTLAAGIAHDMNNVLGSITSFASLLTEDAAPSTRRDLAQILTQAERGAVLTRGLLAFSHRGQYRKQVVKLDTVVGELLPLLARTLPKSIEIRLELHLGDACVDADPVHIGQALINCGLNAADAMDGNGTLTIHADVVDIGASTSLPPGRYARLVTRDTGKGMDEATRQRVFEPFFTTKPLGSGTGLGLSTVWGIVKAHDGTVDVESTLGSGTAFTILLPISNRLPVPIATRPALHPVQPHSTVLLVEDEPSVRESTKRLLERSGLTVVAGVNGADGVRLFAAHADTIDLVILDMGMPVMGGAECFRQIRLRSEVPILIATGYARDEEAQRLVAAGATILEKPFRSDELRRQVERLLAPARACATAA